MGYAATVYLVFLAVLGYAAGFFADFAVPRGIDRGPHAAWPAAVAIDLLLLCLFAVQHTVMARPWFKRRWNACHTGACRTGELRAGREPDAGAALLAVAAGRRDRLERVRTGRRRALGPVRGRDRARDSRSE